MQTKTDLFFTSFDGELLFASEHTNSLKPKKTYILLSGLGGCSTSWHFFIQEFLQLYPDVRCIAVDLRGHGKSSHAFSKQAAGLLDCLAKDLAALLKQINPEKTELHFVGHSLGCIILQTFFAQEKNPFASIFFCAARVKIHLFGSNFSWLYPLLAKWSKNHSHGMRQLSVVDHLKYKNTHDVDVFRLLNDTTIIGKVTYAFLWFCIFGWESKKIASLNSPKVHWIFGEQDIFIREKEKAPIYKRYPLAQYHQVDCNHCIVVNQPIVLARLVAKNS
ncbi:MAG: alpha/beta hydrolase [bacterium]|nr:alpha/beta hydrolase [bacterium]